MARVVILEDEPAIAWILREALGEAGHEVTVVGDARGALSQLEQPPPPDLLLVDLHLPGLRGRDLIEALRGRPHLGATPIVLITGAVPGGDDFPTPGSYQALLAKPFDLDELLAVVDRWAEPRSGVAARSRRLC